MLQSLSDETPMEDQGSLEEDLRVLLREAYQAGTASPAGQIMPRLVGEIQGHPKLLEVYQTEILRPRLQRLKVLIARARDRGELRRVSGDSHPGRYVRRSYLLPLDRARPCQVEDVK